MTSLVLVPSPAETAIAQLQVLRQDLAAADLPLPDAMSALTRAAALKQWARVARLGAEVAFEAGELHVRAHRRVGDLLLETIASAGKTTYHHGRDEPRTQPFSSLPKGALAAYGLTSKLSSQAQLVAKIPAAEFEQRVEALRCAGRTPTLLPFLRAAATFLTPKRRRLTPRLTRLRHALGDLREVPALTLASEAAAARQLGLALDELLEAYDRRVRPAAIARDINCLLCGREQPASQPAKCQCGGHWLTS